jgi:hypothetical protein
VDDPHVVDRLAATRAPRADTVLTRPGTGVKGWAVGIGHRGSCVPVGTQEVQRIAGRGEQQRAGGQAAVHGAQIGEHLVERPLVGAVEGARGLPHHGGDQIGEGVLTLRVPIAEQAKPRKIAISGGSEAKQINA